MHPQPSKRLALQLTACTLALLMLVSAPLTLSLAGVVTTKEGLQYEGRLGKIATMGENPLAPNAQGGEITVSKIVLIDDQLRRTYISSLNVQGLAESPASQGEKILVKQPVARAGRRVGAVGAVLNVTPWDKYGRRIFSMSGPEGKRLDIIQGITEITPTYCKIEALASGSYTFNWDLRVATSSIPRSVLEQVILRQGDPEDPDTYMRLVRLFVQSSRFRDARHALELTLEKFPELTDLKKQINSMRQTGARHVIDEIELRQEAGQHQFAYAMLSNFPADGVAGETLLKVRDLLSQYDKQKQQGEQVKAQLETHQAELTDPTLRERVRPMCEEIATDMNYETLDRMADYLRLGTDPDLAADQKLALAISGWLMGNGAGEQNLAVATSLYDVRNLIREYLQATHKAGRDGILEKIQGSEGASPQNVAKLLAHMKPAHEPPPAEAQIDEVPGYFKLTTAGMTGQADYEYEVQLPPGYDPYRRYPCVVSLHGAGTSPALQVDWWAGPYNKETGSRYGQATRHGYIVIAPKWTKPHQTDYEYSAREHAIVLHSLRDCQRRFNIDTDRIYLSGHSMGGDAAWDLALAHPCLWAGAMPIVARHDKYIARYWENARYTVPLYFVSGELDGNSMVENGPQFDRYFDRAGFDCTVVEYQGRGHEHFHDEIQRLFDWMNAHRRTPAPKEIEYVSMRPWDNFIYWVELDGYPDNAMTHPVLWPPERGARPAPTSARFLENNGVIVNTSAESATIYFLPDLVDFGERVPISFNRRKRNEEIKPSVATMLDDVRTRGDRYHPFWAKYETAEMLR